MIKKLNKQWKKYLNKVEKKNYWKNLAIVLLFIKFIFPDMLYYMTVFISGLLNPNLESSVLTEIYTNASESLSNGFFNFIVSLFESGQNIALSSPLLAKIIVFAIGSLYISIFSFCIYFIIDLIIYIILKIKRGAIKKA